MSETIDRRTFVKKTAANLIAASALSSPRVLNAAPTPAKSLHEWPVYGGDQGASRYSPLGQINRSNVRELRVAWVHHTGDSMQRPATTIECTPIVVDGVMYLTTARLKVQALAASSGRLLWTFDPFAGVRDSRARGVNRGVTYWRHGTDERIFVVARSNLLALNAKDGKLIESFGENGAVDLGKELDRDIGSLLVQATTPGPVFEDLLIIGAGGGEGPRPAAPGHIRAYDTRTGKRRWIFHTIPHPGEFGSETWPPDAWERSGGANCWGGMSVDVERGIVFIATGSPTFDFYGGDRIGQNLFGNCTLALKAATGERIWHFQTTHHDIWDYDNPCQPILIPVRHEGRRVDAVVQLTKMGMAFVFDRQTGKPLFPIEERPMPASDLPGEQAWPTQPFPVKPPPFARQTFYEKDVVDVDPEVHARMKDRFKKARAGDMYVPPSKQGTITFPGFHGGALWGGGSTDPERGWLFVNSNEIPNLTTIEDAKPDAGYRYKQKGYQRFEDETFYPGIKPPWGQITAIDLNQGKFVWQVPLGEYEELRERGIPQTGTENMGGSIATKGKLIFIAATKDEKFRAFDTDTGKVLWETKLEAGGYATPCTYEAAGKQYVVIAAGGAGKNRTKSGDAFVAFALP